MTVEVNETESVPPQEEKRRRRPKGSPMETGRRRSAEPEDEPEQKYEPKSYSDLAQHLAACGVKNAYTVARQKRPDLYRAALRSAMLSATRTVRKK